ncbi:LacI family DNA-binding transcriptional regulator [Actinoplanes xinjiangensis]|uniref:DNA-binding LacI/PurR family transcriptional regulator n=1 Tax=Actinoplanes xinjiangensis TaxID=512350 RepID=A0A316G1C6_9ACTN|nr:LacI family DNA-binding transcriptional regulator [Actinoplanes xinjiangensis]PWK48167.1 DNA-binding LacI/PurR family transcriptional regulator [Actinoplanes xinjiangensis]GIF39079.1 LacI family transcriptional regulator [Actinoplanes xinjiangensis]
MTQASRRVGLVLERASHVLGEEAYYHEFLEGLERVLAPAGVSVLVQVVTDRAAEIATYERWSAQARVDGVVLVDLGPDDERVGLVARLGLPAVVLGDPSTAQGLPTVWTDDAGFAREAVDFLAGLGHRVAGHVTGPPAFAHTQLRRGGLQAEAAERGMTLLVAEGDYSYDGGRAAALELLETRGVRPTAIVFDNDVMALGGLDAAAACGLRVPADLSVVAWDDSPQCQLAMPALSAMSHDVERIGELAARAVLATMAGAPVEVYQAPPAHIVVRSSTQAPAS